MIKKTCQKSIILIILIATIAFSPRFPIGEIAGNRLIDIRAEDILLLILGLSWLINFLVHGQTQIKKPPLWTPIIAWLGIGFFSVLLNLTLNNITLSRGFFYFLKEIEFFFIYFYLFYHLKRLSSVKLAIKIWFVVGLMNILLIFYQFARGFRYGEYGPGLYKEIGPFPSGGFFLILFANLFNIFLYYHRQLKISRFKKIVLLILIFSLTIGIVASGSRAAVMGFVLVIISSFFLYQIKTKNIKALLASLFILCSFGATTYLISFRVHYLQNLQPHRLLRSFNSRDVIWQAQLQKIPDNPIYYLFGLGKSAYLYTEESHNQYLRNFIETGIIGSLIFLILIWAILKTSWRNFFKQTDKLLIGLSAGLLTSTLAMLLAAIPNDAFIVVKVNEVYWFFAGLTFSTYYLNRPKNISKLTVSQIDKSSFER